MWETSGSDLRGKPEAELSVKYPDPFLISSQSCRQLGAPSFSFQLAEMSGQKEAARREGNCSIKKKSGEAFPRSVRASPEQQL